MLVYSSKKRLPRKKKTKKKYKSQEGGVYTHDDAHTQVYDYTLKLYYFIIIFFLLYGLLAT